MITQQTDEKVVEIKNVSKGFNISSDKKFSFRQIFTDPFSKIETKEFKALDRVSFDIEKGEFLGIIGRNGGGKSTLLKMLAGIYDPDMGEVIVRGNIVPFLELGVGFNPELTARENIYLNGTILGLTRKQINSKFDEIVDFAEINEFIEMPLKNFSSGMTVRLAFSIAINVKGDVYLVDEVLAVGDAVFQQKCFDIFNEFKRDKKTVILVTHDLNLVQKYCDRAILINEHKVEKDGRANETVEYYLKLIQETK